MKKPRHRVSDHAVLRYLQRVQGFDIEALRRRIGRIVDRHQEHGAASGIISGGFVYKLKGGVVATVFPANRRHPKPENRGRRGAKHGRS